MQFIFAFFGPSTNNDDTSDYCHIGNSRNELSDNENRVEIRWLCADDCMP